MASIISRAILATLLLALLSQPIAGDEVCYDSVGCFTNDPPFDNALGELPHSPEEVNPQYLLYQRDQRDGPYPLDYLDPNSPGALAFNPRLETKFIIHGYASYIGTPWMMDMTYALLEHGDYNVIQVGWNADFPNYPAAVANTRLVGKTTAMVIDILREKGLDLKKAHVIGHSLGAHTAGYTGTNLGSDLGRITGLDPAGTLFDGYPAEVVLDPADAQFVDVIHTNGHPFSLTIEGFGTSYPSGHVDYYPNGGVNQPGCVDGIAGAINAYFEAIFSGDWDSVSEDAFAELACSHGRSYEYFIESINSSPCQFISVPCDSYDDFEAGNCVHCDSKGCNVAGLGADQSIPGREEYLDTLSQSPYCGYSYVATITPDGDANELRGTLTATFTSTVGTETVSLGEGVTFPMTEEEPYKFVFTNGKDLGTVTGVQLHYERIDIAARRSFLIAEFRLEKVASDLMFETSLSESVELSIDIDASLSLS